MGCGRLSAEELPVETFFRHYDYTEAWLSPDGACVGVLAPFRNQMELAIVDLEKNKASWAYTALGVSWFRWASTNRLIFGSDIGPFSVMLAANKDGSQCVTLPQSLVGQTRLLATLPESPNEVLVNSFAHSAHLYDTLLLFPNVERMNLFTGASSIVVKNPGKVFQWIADHQGVVRAGIAKEEKTFKVLYRADANAAWQTIAEFKWNEDGFVPECFESDNRTLLVRATGDGDTEGLYSYDLTNRKFKDLAFRHAEVDLGNLIFAKTQHRLMGVSYQAERPEVMWFDPSYRKIQVSVDHALTNTFNQLINTSLDGTRALFLARNDRTPGTYYLVDMASSKLRKLFNVADWIHPDQMAEMKPIEYQARDGLTIHGYLTLPRDRPGKNLPMVVNPHGGPLVRDTWGFDPEVQFLANRGYAVLQMNFRGSAGYGKAFREADYKQWGLKQQDDITHGVKWTIAQGIADPRRVAIYGASYGGFAALTGLEKTPELYRCGISMAGVTDVVRTIDRSKPTLTMLKLFLAETVGGPEKGQRPTQRKFPDQTCRSDSSPGFPGQRGTRSQGPHRDRPRIGQGTSKTRLSLFIHG